MPGLGTSTVSEIIAGLISISAKMDAWKTQQDVFSEVFPGAKYHKGQIASVWTILGHAGEKLKMHHSCYGKGCGIPSKDAYPLQSWTKFAGEDVITALEDKLSSPCISDDEDLWDSRKIFNISKSPLAPFVIDLSSHLSDEESELVNQCPWCDLELPADFKPSPMLFISVRIL